MWRNITYRAVVAASGVSVWVERVRAEAVQLLRSVRLGYEARHPRVFHQLCIHMEKQVAKGKRKSEVFVASKIKQNRAVNEHRSRTLLPRTSYKSPLLVATRIFMPRGSVHTEWRAEETGSGKASRIENVLTLRSPSSHRITNLVEWGGPR